MIRGENQIGCEGWCRSQVCIDFVVMRSCVAVQPDDCQGREGRAQRMRAKAARGKACSKSLDQGECSSCGFFPVADTGCCSPLLFKIFSRFGNIESPRTIIIEGGGCHKG